MHMRYKVHTEYCKSCSIEHTLICNMYVVWGTCRLQAIQKTGKLRKMARTHIHFASEAHHMRANAWANVLLKLDLQRALEEGYLFFRSSNGVVLAEGPIPVRFLTPVIKDDLLGKK